MQAVSRVGAQAGGAASPTASAPVPQDPIETTTNASIALLALGDRRASTTLDTERYLTLLAHLEHLPGTTAAADAVALRRRHDALGSTDVATLRSAIALPVTDRPRLSVVVATEGVVTALRLLVELSFACTAVAFEVVLAGEASEADPALADIKHLRYAKSVDGCETIADVSRGEIILFLAGAGALGFGCLDELMLAFTGDFALGLVGPKLIDKAGSLVAAGGIVDGSGVLARYRPAADPDDSRSSYNRPVDAVLPECFAVRRTALIASDDASRFLRNVARVTDEAAADLTFRLREADWGVGYVANAHFYCEVTDDRLTMRSQRRAGFKQAWAGRFRLHGRRYPPSLAADRWFVGTAWLVDKGGDPGSARGFGNEARRLAALGYKVVLVSVGGSRASQREWARAGVETIAVPDIVALTALAAERAGAIDLTCLRDDAELPGLLAAVHRSAPEARTLLFAGNGEPSCLAGTTALTLHEPGCEGPLARPVAVSLRPRAPATPDRVATLVVLADEAGSDGPHAIATPLLAAPLPDLVVRELDADMAQRVLASEAAGDAFFATSDVLAIASHRSTDAGHLALAAAARSLPLVIPSVLASRLGFRPGRDCFAADDADEWLAALTLLMGDEDTRSLLGERAAAVIATHYRPEAAVLSMREILARLDLPLL